MNFKLKKRIDYLGVRILELLVIGGYFGIWNIIVIEIWVLVDGFMNRLDIVKERRINWVIVYKKLLDLIIER